MKVLNLGCCSEFSSSTKAAERPLNTWITVIRNAEWRNFAEARRTFGAVDVVGKFHVFNIAGRKYRLIATVNYEFGWVKVERVLTHSAYDKFDIRQLR